MNLHRFTTSTFLVRQTAKVEASLRCRLVTRGHPALLLQPAKVEEQSLDPMIVVLHDLLTDKQTEILRQLGEPKVRHFRMSPPYFAQVYKCEEFSLQTASIFVAQRRRGKIRSQHDSH